MNSVERELRRLARRELLWSLWDNLAWPIGMLAALGASCYQFGLEATAAFCGAIAPIGIIALAVITKLERREKNATSDKP